MPTIKAIFRPHIRKVDVQLTPILIIVLVGDMAVFLIVVELIDTLG